MLQTIRKRLKMTQQDMANELGVSQRTIGNWEREHNRLALKAYKMVAIEKMIG